jgi:hypothetical protein
VGPQIGGQEDAKKDDIKLVDRKVKKDGLTKRERRRVHDDNTRTGLTDEEYEEELEQERRQRTKTPPPDRDERRERRSQKERGKG